MAEYIDREKIFPNGVFYVNKNQPEKSLDELINRICKAPVADVVEVVHGRWIFDGYSLKGEKVYKCSKCNYAVANLDEVGMKYCPNCGAKMDGDRND